MSVRFLVFVFLFAQLSDFVYAEELNKNTTKSVSKYTLVPEVGSTSFHMVGIDSAYLGGLSLGASVRFPTSSNQLDWSVGLLYLQTGFKQVAHLGIFDIELGHVNLDYLGVPLRAEYSINNPNSSDFIYFVSGGLTPIYLLSAKQKITLGDETSEFGIRSHLNGFDTLAGVGLGVRYTADVGVVEASLDYQHGLFNVEKEGKSKQEGLMARVGYNMSL